MREHSTIKVTRTPPRYSIKVTIGNQVLLLEKEAKVILVKVHINKEKAKGNGLALKEVARKLKIATQHKKVEVNIISIV